MLDVTNEFKNQVRKVEEPMKIFKNSGTHYRQRARKARKLPDERPDGWSLSPVDPSDVVRVFRWLRLKPGWKLCAYLYGSNGNGNGLVWAIPEDQPVPLPEDCERVGDGLFAAPRPPGALGDFMTAIKGNGSPQSYLFASILARELREFGAMWHGRSWDDVGVLSGAARGFDEIEPGYWTWAKPCPDHFGPFFERVNGIPRVTLHLYSHMGGESIFRVVDTYRRKGYRFKTTGTDLAKGQLCVVY